MVVQRLDHDCGPVLNDWIIFHTAAPASSGQFRRNRKTSLLTLYHVPLTRRICVCRSSLLNWAKFKNQSRRGGCIQPAHPLPFLKGADYNSSIH